MTPTVTCLRCGEPLSTDCCIGALPYCCVCWEEALDEPITVLGLDFRLTEDLWRGQIYTIRHLQHAGRCDLNFIGVFQPRIGYIAAALQQYLRTGQPIESEEEATLKHRLEPQALIEACSDPVHRTFLQRQIAGCETCRNRLSPQGQPCRRREPDELLQGTVANRSDGGSARPQSTGSRER